MIKNRITQLIFRSIYLTLAFFGLLASFGLFNVDFNQNWYVYYTNLSNFIFILVMIPIIKDNVRQLSLGNMYGLNTKYTRIKYYATIWIIVTFLVYNILLGDPTTMDYWSSVNNLTFHLGCPLVFFLDWLLFDDHSGLRWWDNLAMAAAPVIYVFYIVIRGAVITPDADTVVYPYFFLDVDELGMSGVIRWVVILVAFFVGLGFVFWGVSRLFSKKNKK